MLHNAFLAVLARIPTLVQDEIEIRCSDTDTPQALLTGTDINTAGLQAISAGGTSQHTWFAGISCAAEPHEDPAASGIAHFQNETDCFEWATRLVARLFADTSSCFHTNILHNNPAACFSAGAGGAATAASSLGRLNQHGGAQSDYGQRNSMHIIRYIVTFPPGTITDTTEPNLVHVLYEAMRPFVADSLLTDDHLRSDIIANVNGGSANAGASTDSLYIYFCDAPCCPRNERSMGATGVGSGANSGHYERRGKKRGPYKTKPCLLPAQCRRKCCGN